jgi:hypothetical protein
MEEKTITYTTAADLFQSWTRQPFEQKPETQALNLSEELEIPVFPAAKANKQAAGLEY